jgi:type I restriction enzyme S subunit
MSKLEQLIADLCPDGVEYKELQEVFTIRNGYTPSKDTPEFWEDGSIPWFRMEDIRENGRILSDSIQHITPKAIKGSLFPADSMIIATSATVGEHALLTVEALANQRFTFLTRKMPYLKTLDIKYFFYHCDVLDEWCKQNTTLGNFNSVDMTKFKKYKFPLPPLPVQQEIVRILDKFTELEAELEAELVARTKQYEYYRDELLTFGDDVERKTLREIGFFYGGLSGKSKEDFTDGNAKFITYMNVFNNIALDTNTSGLVKVGENEKQNSILYGDVLFTGSSETPDECGMSSVLIQKTNEKLYLNSFCFGFRLNDISVLLPDFSKYLFRSEELRKQIQRTASGVTRFNVSKKKMERIIVPIPPLEEQTRIVAILDRFDALVNDITTGLPAEIAARRKQYEYYRDKLLTFKERQ